MAERAQRGSSVRDSMARLWPQSWFVLLLAGMGCAFALVETHRSLLNGRLPLSPYEALFTGELLGTVGVGVAWHIAARSRSTTQGLFVGHPYRIALPVALYCVSTLGTAMAAILPAWQIGWLLWCLSIALGASSLALAFAWVEILASLRLDAPTSLCVVGGAIGVSAVFQLLVATLCTSASTTYVLAVLAVLLLGAFVSVERHARVPDGLPAQESQEEAGAETTEGRRWSFVFLPALYFLAFCCLFHDGAAPSGSLAAVASQLLSAAGTAGAAAITVFLARHMTDAHIWFRSSDVLLFLVMVACCLVAFLSRASVASDLPLYLSRKLIFVLVCRNAFVRLRMSDRMADFAASLSLWVLAWFAWRGIDCALDIMDMSNAATYEGLSLAILAGIAICVFAGAVRNGSDREAPQQTDTPQAEPADALDTLGIQWGLTERERQLLPDIAGGFGADSIARRFQITPTTVRTHAHNIYAKAGVASQHELVELVSGTIAEKGRPR